MIAERPKPDAGERRRAEVDVRNPVLRRLLGVRRRRIDVRRRSSDVITPSLAHAVRESMCDLTSSKPDDASQTWARIRSKNVIRYLARPKRVIRLRGQPQAEV